MNLVLDPRGDLPAQPVMLGREFVLRGVDALRLADDARKGQPRVSSFTDQPAGVPNRSPGPSPVNASKNRLRHARSMAAIRPILGPRRQ